MPDLTTCSNCSEEVTTDSDFCPQCGYLFKEAPVVHCERDFNQEASGVCIICQKVVCPRCREVRNHRLFCIEHKDVLVQENWALVFESHDVVDVELMKSYLDANGIQALVQNMGMRAKSRGSARVFVPIPEYLAAKKTLEEVA